MYRIRIASAADVAFLGRWDDNALQHIENPATELNVIELDDRPVGRLRLSRTAEALQLNGIQLLPEVQNHGLGTAIITQLQSEAASTGVPLDLGVEHDNPNARRLYDRLGFRQIDADEHESKLRWLSPAAARQNEIWSVDTARGYDTPGAGMFAAEVLGPTLDRLAALAGDGRALEFAIGTGRVAVPLAERGVAVSGIEFSTAMLDQLRTKVAKATIPVVVGDMSAVQAPGEFTVVYLVYNTISNLLTQEEQVACFRNAARHLSPGGHFVIELWVPELRRLPPGIPATVGIADSGYILLDTYDVLQQHVVSHHFHFGEGNQAELFRSPHRYIWPAELDLMAQLAGFTLESRHADWTGTDFTAESPSHVSVYRLSAA